MSIHPHQQYSISLLVNNKPGVLIRIALVFMRRGYNMESLVVSAAQDHRFSRMTVVVTGESGTFEQIIMQLNKLVDVISAYHHAGENSVEKEMALMKVKCDTAHRSEVLQIVEHFKAQTIDITETTLMIQVTGGPDKINAMHTMLDKYSILESVRSGKLIMARGAQTT